MSKLVLRLSLGRLVRVGRGGGGGGGPGHSHRRRRAGAVRGCPTVEEPARWHQRYESTLRRVQGAGVRLQAGMEAGWREYRRRRHDWELELPDSPRI